MNTITATARRQPELQFLRRIGDELVAAKERWRRRRLLRHTRRQLHALPEFVLRDIGLARGEIDTLVVTADREAERAALPMRGRRHD